jgi:hypothetical protein
MITGWRNGLDKVRLNHLLRQYAGLALGEAKRMVDDLLAGHPVTFDATDPSAATAFCRSANEIGANCSVATEPRMSASSSSSSTS